MEKKFDIKKLKYDIDQVLGYFELIRGHDCDLLRTWTTVDTANYKLTELLEEKRLRLLEEGDVWNEEELKMHFVSLIFAVADTNIDKVCKTFYERPITGVVQEKQLHVICDCMIAQPDRAGLPTKPYFFFFKSLNKPNALAKPTPKGKCWQLCCLPKK